MVASPENENVSFTEPHALRFLRSFKFRPRDRFPRFQPFDAAETGNIQQHAPAHDAMGKGGNVLEGWSVRGYRTGRFPVVELPLVSNMAERVDVRVAITVKLGG